MASHGVMLLSTYTSIIQFKWYNIICCDKFDGMENAIAFSFTLLSLELAEIEGIKAGVFLRHLLEFTT